MNSGVGGRAVFMGRSHPLLVHKWVGIIKVASMHGFGFISNSLSSLAMPGQWEVYGTIYYLCKGRKYMVPCTSTEGNQQVNCNSYQDVFWTASGAKHYTLIMACGKTVIEPGTRK